jgi:hypothetical protein
MTALLADLREDWLATRARMEYAREAVRREFAEGDRRLSLGDVAGARSALRRADALKSPLLDAAGDLGEARYRLDAALDAYNAP